MNNITNLGSVVARLAKARNAQATERDWTVADDGNGIYLKLWNESALGAPPTQAQLDAEETAMLEEQKAAQDKLAADKLEQDKVRAMLTDLKNGTGTSAERLRRCEVVLYRLIIDIYK